MKARRLALMIVAAIVLSSAAAVVSGQTAFAACGGPNQQPCPDKEKKPTATDVPATATSTQTPTPVPPAAACGTPDANQLQLLCAGLPPAQGAGDPNSGGQPLNKPPSPNVPTPPAFLGPISLTGILIGLLTGILIGLLLPSALRGVRWGARGDGEADAGAAQWHKAAAGIIGPVDAWQELNGGIVTPTDSQSKKFKKLSDKPGSGEGELAPPPPGSAGNAFIKGENAFIKGESSGLGELAPPPPGSVGDFHKLAPPPPGSVGDTGFEK